MLKIKMSAKRGNIINKHICRLCLKAAEKEVEIDEITRKIFDTLLIKLELGISRDPIICQDCMEGAKKYLNFKYTCINTDKNILSYSVNRKEVKHDIKVIYTKRKYVTTVFDDDFRVCRFCMTRMARNNFVSLDTLMNESRFQMLPQYMAEMDFSIIENPLICGYCRENMDGYFKFMLNYVNIEQKIREYCKINGCDNAGEVKLGNVLQFILTNIVGHPTKCSQTCKVNQDDTGCTYPKQPYSELIKQEELNIKDEEMILNEEHLYRSEIKADKDSDAFLPKEYHHEPKLDMISMDMRERMTEGNAYKKNYQANFTGDHENDSSIMQINKRVMCAGKTKGRAHGKNDLIGNRDVPKLDIYQGILYTAEIKQQNASNDDMSNPKGNSEPKQTVVQIGTSDPQSYIPVDVGISSTFKCSLCSYKSKYKWNLNTHMSIHKDVSEIKMFKCSFCAYQGRHKVSLNKHMWVHKDISEIKMFKCSLCAFEFKHKRYLRSHIMVIHKDVSEIEMFKCSSCPFESKHKSSLKSHMLIHKDISEVQTFKCSFCSFESKHKRSLRSHMLVHRDVSEIQTFKCALCAYAYKHKSSLKTHMLTHKDVSEIEMFKCSLCSFETKYKSSLKPHMSIHNKTFQK